MTSLPDFSSLPSRPLSARNKAELCPYLAQLIAELPDWTATLFAQGQNKDAYHTVFTSLLDALAIDAPRASDTKSLMTLLRQCKKRAALLIALADLGNLWSVGEVTHALSRLADSVVLYSVRHLLRSLVARGKLSVQDLNCPERDSGLIILAMGKWGASELNYSSDIDFIVFYDVHACRHADKESLPPLFIKLTRDLIRILEEFTEEGFVFRTDIRLRPDPHSTPPALSIHAAEIYYSSQALNWERAAMIKARPVACDPIAAEGFMRLLHPFLWRRHLDFIALRDIHAIIQQIHTHQGGDETTLLGYNIKLGRGGIRSIEFYAQTQQLIYGGREIGLRSPRTTEALLSLAKAGRISDDCAQELIESYTYLRRLEHRLQMIDDQQTHSLPQDEGEMQRLALLMDKPLVGHFEAELSLHLARVTAYVDQLFDQSSTDPIITGAPEDLGLSITLEQLGFKDTERIMPLVAQWQQARYRCLKSPRAQELLSLLMPKVLRALARTADPDAAATNFDQFLARLPAGVQLFALFEANPNLLVLLADIMGTAPSLAEQLSTTPQLLECVLEEGFFDVLPNFKALQDNLVLLLSSQQLDYEEQLLRLRTWAQEQRFRGGIHILLNLTPADKAAPFFSDIADLTLTTLLQAVQAQFEQRHGLIKGGSLALIALGKLGTRMMSVQSDIDLIAIYDAPVESLFSDGGRALSVSDYYTRLLARLVEAITALSSQGRLYELDLRLRPSGNKGPLATNLEAFIRYQKNAAWTWEHMALTKARVITATPALKEKIEQTLASIITAKRDHVKLKQDVAEMRALIATEHKARGAWDLKYRRGGLIDIEFIEQYASLGGSVPPETLMTLHPLYLRLIRLQAWLRLTYNFFATQTPNHAQLFGMAAALCPEGDRQDSFIAIENDVAATCQSAFTIYQEFIDKNATSDEYMLKKVIDKTAIHPPSIMDLTAHPHRGDTVMALKVGMPAPDFTLPLATFGTISLSNMRGKPVVLYFYPKDDTPGCTTEACAFRDALPQFANFDAAIIGVSKDTVESHAAFAKKYGINFHLASDANSDVCETYDVWVTKNLYGNISQGIERSTFLIDSHGIIRGIWRKVSVNGHAEEIAKAVELLALGLPIPGQELPPPPTPVTPVFTTPAPVTEVTKSAAEGSVPKTEKAEQPAAKKAEPKPKKVEPKKTEAKPAAKAVAKKAEPKLKKVEPKKTEAKPVAKSAAKKAKAKPTAKKAAPKAAAKKIATAKPAAKKAVKATPAKATTKKIMTKAAAPKKTAAKKATPKAPVKKIAAKTTVKKVTSKATPKKAVVAKAVTKKVVAKKATAKPVAKKAVKAAPKKVTVKKVAAKTAPKKVVAKKTTPKKAAPKIAPKKVAVKKVAAKPAAKKVVVKKKK